MVAHHQIMFKISNPTEYDDAVEFCRRAVSEDITDLRRETTSLFNFFTERVGDIVDLNLDYFPEMIVVTFVQHQDVLKALSNRDPHAWRYKGTSTLKNSKEMREWNFSASKVDFICHVRNCQFADD